MQFLLSEIGKSMSMLLRRLELSWLFVGGVKSCQDPIAVNVDDESRTKTCGV